MSSRRNRRVASSVISYLLNAHALCVFQSTILFSLNLAQKLFFLFNTLIFKWILSTKQSWALKKLNICEEYGTKRIIHLLKMISLQPLPSPTIFYQDSLFFSKYLFKNILYFAMRGKKHIVYSVYLLSIVFIYFQFIFFSFNIFLTRNYFSILSWDRMHHNNFH